jgi:two-component system response regulator NreC
MVENTMIKTRLLIAVDHAVVRDGLRTLFRGMKEFSIVGEAADGETAVRYASLMKPDVAILDISMPKLNGVEATRLIKLKHPEIKVLILTIHEDEEYVYQVIRAGANGYMLKNAEKKEILGAVRAVVGGESFFSPGISKLIIDKFIKRAKEHNEIKPSNRDSLTSRERQVLEFIAHGFTSREIAEKIFLSVSTINTHRANLMQKLNIHDTAGLVRYAVQQGMVKIQS